MMRWTAINNCMNTQYFFRHIIHLVKKYFQINQLTMAHFS